MGKKNAYIGNIRLLKELKLYIIYLISYLWSLKPVEILLQARYNAVSWKHAINYINQ